MPDSDARVVVITGAASGMGAACARRFASAGDRVVIVDRDADGAHAVADEIGAEARIGDVSDEAFTGSVISSVLESLGRIDVLVNAAGVIVRAAAHETSTEAWRRIFSVNVDGVFFMSRAAVPPMVERGSGAVVNFGSVWGELGNAGHAAYTATKGAVHQLTRSMALELATTGVRVNAVAPGEIRTPMLASERATPMTDADLDAIGAATVPMQRLGEPEEVAEVVAFLASDAASYMTGSIVTVDAGYSAR